MTHVYTCDVTFVPRKCRMQSCILTRPTNYVDSKWDMSIGYVYMTIFFGGAQPSVERATFASAIAVVLRAHTRCGWDTHETPIVWYNMYILPMAKIHMPMARYILYLATWWWDTHETQSGQDPQDALSLSVIFHKRARGARRRSALAPSCRAPTGLDQINEDIPNGGVYSHMGVYSKRGGGKHEMNVSRQVWMSHVTCAWGTFAVQSSRHVRMCHVTYEWVTSHVDETLTRYILWSQ